MENQKQQLNKRKHKPATAPYISITKLEDVINLVSNRNYSDFTTDIFKNRGFSKVDAFLAMNTLRFLNLITDDRKPTEQMKKIGLKGDSRKEAFKEVIQNAYKKLFDIVEKPQDLPFNELFNEIKTQYNLSGRIARQAVPVFLKMAEFAGLIEEGSVISRKRKSKTDKKTVQKRKTTTQPFDHTNESSFGEGIENKNKKCISENLTEKWDLIMRSRKALDTDVREKATKLMEALEKLNKDND